MKPQQPSERRFNVRRDVNEDFAAMALAPPEYVTNVSRSGAFIRSLEPLPVGTEVALCFSVILEELETVEGVGEVVRVTDPAEKAEVGMGVAFRGLTARSHAVIEQLLVHR